MKMATFFYEIYLTILFYLYLYYISFYLFFILLFIFILFNNLLHVQFTFLARCVLSSAVLQNLDKSSDVKILDFFGLNPLFCSFK